MRVTLPRRTPREGAAARRQLRRRVDARTAASTVPSPRLRGTIQPNSRRATRSAVLPRRCVVRPVRPCRWEALECHIETHQSLRERRIGSRAFSSIGLGAMHLSVAGRPDRPRRRGDGAGSGRGRRQPHRHCRLLLAWGGRPAPQRSPCCGGVGGYGKCRPFSSGGDEGWSHAARWPTGRSTAVRPICARPAADHRARRREHRALPAASA